MGLPALQQAFEAFSDAPEPPELARRPAETRAQLRDRMAKTVLEFGGQVLRWRTSTYERLAQLRQVYADLAAKGENAFSTASRDELGALIERVSERLSHSKDVVSEAERQWRWALDPVKGMPAQEARFLRKQVRRALNQLADMYDNNVDFYYSLLALAAEYDPETRSGPTFDNAEDLVAYLRASNH